MFTRMTEYVSQSSKTAVKFWHESASEFLEDRVWLKAAMALITVYLLLALGLGIYWSAEPQQVYLGQFEAAVTTAQKDANPVTGVATTTALIGVVSTLLNKPGGYLSNDITPPGIWLDNIPNWEYGALVQVRDLARVIQESFSRSQSQSSEDTALKDAQAQFNFDNQSWIMPSSEDEYERGIEYLLDYLTRLQDHSQQNAQFFARADNLRYWLGSVDAGLGSLSQKLSASVGTRRLNTDLAGDSAATQSTANAKEFQIKTPVGKIDDVFYEARGASWALIQLLVAVEADFAEVLEKKNARVSLQQIIRELEGTQQPLRSPFVLNGGGFGMLANHSLVMANYISRANAALIDLRELLSNG